MRFLQYRSVKVPGNNLRLQFQRTKLILRFCSGSCTSRVQSYQLRPQFIAVSLQFTAGAFTTRTGRPCSALSFQEIASGLLPESLIATHPTHQEHQSERHSSGQVSGEVAGNKGSEFNFASFPTIYMTICSFALHLDDSSRLWALLSELRWKLDPPPAQNTINSINNTGRLKHVDGGINAELMVDNKRG